MNLFNSIRVRPPRMNRFNLSHEVKLTGKFGKLIPIMCQDVLPGDVFRCNSEVLLRMAPMIAPIMTKVNVYTHFFFCPKRLTWDNWKEFITGGPDGLDDVVYPRYRLTNSYDTKYHGFGPGSLCDYLGFPVINNPDGRIHPNNSVEIDALPIRAYQLIYNEYYRDQNIMEEIDIQKDMDGIIDVVANSKNVNLFELRNRCWKKDYFTSALPFAQRGADVELPLGGMADISYNNDNSVASIPPLSNVLRKTRSDVDPYVPYNGFGGHENLYVGDSHELSNENGEHLYLGTDDDTNNYNLNIDLSKIIKGVDLSGASSATINELRRAIKAQEFLELAARGGSRYIEQIYAYFGVRSSDARLQRPEFLGGGKSPVMVSDVLQTSQSTENSAQANPSGHGVSVQRSHSFKFRAEEHGYIIGIMSVMPDAAYMQGMPRLYNKFDRLDYYWPQFAHLGEQEILNKELYFDASAPASGTNNPDGTFGYTPRYAEYKFAMDSIHGDFRNSLSFWHMGRIFSKEPGLNPEFLTNVEDAANRVFNVVNDDVDKLWVNIHHNLIALRKMPKYGTPLF